MNGVSSLSSFAIPIAIAVFPVPGYPAIRIARPAILPSRIIRTMTPADRRAYSCPTIPWEIARASKLSSSPSPRMCECAPILSMRVSSFSSEILGTAIYN